MTFSLGLYSEPYGSTGNIGENFLRLLGAPKSDPLQTVIREAVQNVADAAKLGKGPRILIRLRHLSTDESSALKARVLCQLPNEEYSKEKLERFLAREKQLVLEICDFDTTGLGGPTRADRIPDGEESVDFINFLRNIGAPRDTEHGGGTYGFGKASLYTVSRCQTILVDTQVKGDLSEERRLIGCHIGPRHEILEGGFRRQFTGRHWWGISDPDDGIADPVRNSDATELASALGFPERRIQDSGTSIMILDFNPEGEDLETVGNRIVEGLLYSFWPRMMKDVPNEKRFSCKVEVEGAEIPIPAPEEFAPLHLFCRAMRHARARHEGSAERICSKRPARDLGWLAIERGLASPRRPLVAENSLFQKISRHIALMRPVELVVKYLEGVALPDERLEWAGVFLCSDDVEVERAFARSEPPAHDDWIPGNIERGEAKTFVNVALRNLEIRASEMGLPSIHVASGDADAPPLARISGLLGAALEGATGEGAGRPRSQPQGNGSSRVIRARASRPVFLRLELRDDAKVAKFSTNVQQDQEGSGELLRIQASVAIDGSAKRQSDGSFELPEVLEIRSTDSALMSVGDQLRLDGAAGDFEIYVKMPNASAVIVDAEVTSGGEE